VLKAEAAVRSVLLLNDHYDANWKVSVDGKPEKLLRCNFLMRGVYLVPGTHLVEFKFQPPVGMLCVGLASLATGLLVVAIFVASNKKRVPIPPPSTQPTPAPSLAPIRPKRKPSAR